ncbi:hypothetical protein EJ05DRAFT_69819 [Pseudovirgaria hyperparasitica]|uniref:Zn(2)-C6 fungal-type domain-containing protein n=1 Tax=Pseudovirgaria hyperparasitica TaxID=470096 RepID=A0A6A6W217_9PEZI|nr:uncharacterized protein EJ05DRAFT_69819 [Pseudovirgaria hyperparasitica]KAF2756595.1 hypothetical protein EJ05DRAFT_69819 [Pseudovirgaria hyperparasitica]
MQNAKVRNQRSCIACAQKKVRCDKQTPCDRCQRAAIQCIPPAVSRRPRWAPAARSPAHNPPQSSSNVVHLPTQRRSTESGVSKILSRLDAMEALVHTLEGQLVHARSDPSVESLHLRNSPTLAVLPRQSNQHSAQSSDLGQNLSIRFWSHIDDELKSLKELVIDYTSTEHDHNMTDAQTSTASSSSSSEMINRSQTACYTPAFLLRHTKNDKVHDTASLLPLPSQLPFLLEIYAERIHSIVGIPHLTSLRSLLQQHRTGFTQSTPSSNHALMFAVFFAAVCSMDEQEVQTSLGLSQNELLTRYRIGLESSLVRADFLNNPSYDLVEAVTIFMTLARQDDPPRYVFMMTGILIRMARFLRYHEDGSSGKDLTPFQAEMQRRLWWNLCALDLRATEDQGTELGISEGSHSTQLPVNTNETDISPSMIQTPRQLEGVTSITLLRLCSKITRTAQQMMSASSTDTIEDRVKRLDNLSKELDQDYFAVTDASQHSIYIAAAGTMRIFLGRLTLLAFFPSLFTTPDKSISTSLRSKLVIAAIEVIEHHHALCSDPSCRPWKWVYHTQQHWHAVVYLLIDLCQHPWSPTMERAWIALQSPWLVPTQTSVYKNPSTWVPLKRLIATARTRREQSIQKLQACPMWAVKIRHHDSEHMPVPLSSTTFPAYFNDASFRERWHQMIFSATSGSADTIAVDSSSCGHKSTNIERPRSPVHGMSGAMVDHQLEAATSVSLDSFLGSSANTIFDNHIFEEDDVLKYDWNTWFDTVEDSRR